MIGLQNTGSGHCTLPIRPPACKNAAESLQDLLAGRMSQARPQRFVSHALISNLLSPRIHFLYQLRPLGDTLLPSLAMLRRHILHEKLSIHRLHPEILPRIPYHLPRKIHLICATHPSLYFRNSLMSHPGVRAHVDFKNAERSLAFFGRSGPVPLHVVFPCRPLLPAQTELFHQNAVRIVTPELDAGPEEWVLLPQPLPSLVKLGVTRDFPESEAEPIPRSLPQFLSTTATLPLSILLTSRASSSAQVYGGPAQTRKSL